MTYLPYPKEVDMQCGCKVSWLYYETLEEAQKASEAAKHNARLDAARGYDFGFCCPGEIDEISENKFKVCIP